LLGDAWKKGVRFRVVAGDRQYDSAEHRQWTKKAFKAETAHTNIHGKDYKKAGGIRVDSKFRVTGLKRLVKAYHGGLCAERIFKKLKRQLSLENHHEGLANVTIHACITLMCVLPVIIAS
jgi:hypothetical protein